MNFVGPLPRSTWGFQFMLITMDYATQFLDMVPFKDMQVQGIAQAVLWLFSCIGRTWEILTDIEAIFTSALMKQLCKLLGIQQQFTTIYHPQTEGLVEWMKQMLKDLLHKMAGAFPSY